MLPKPVDEFTDKEIIDLLKNESDQSILTGITDLKKSVKAYEVNVERAHGRMKQLDPERNSHRILSSEVEVTEETIQQQRDMIKLLERLKKLRGLK